MSHSSYWFLNLNYASVCKAFLFLFGLILFPISTLKTHDLQVTFIFGGDNYLNKSLLLVSWRHFENLRSAEKAIC